MDFESLEDIISKQLQGVLSREEEERLYVWYETSGEHRRQYEQICVLLKAAVVSERTKNFRGREKAAYRRFVERTMNRNRLRRWGLWRYAAVAVVALGIGVLFPYIRQNDRALSVGLQRIEIPLGSKSKIILPDGSQVWLNSGSCLSYTTNFGEGKREVVLDGEGCFEVTKNKDCPFIVKSGEVVVEVLGTRFDFKSYGEDASGRVTLIEGRLKVSGLSAGQTGIILQPDQQAVIDKVARRIEVKKVEAADFAGWTEPQREKALREKAERGQVPNVVLRNTLFFDEEPLEQIVRDLERAFNVQIVIADEGLKQTRFYGDFRNEETLTEIMEIMSSNNSFTYRIDQDRITINRKNKLPMR